MVSPQMSSPSLGPQRRADGAAGHCVKGRGGPGGADCGGGEQVGHLGVLPLGAAAGLLQLAAVLLAQQKGGKLAVDGLQKLGEVDAAVGKMGGEILGLGLATLQQKGRGIVEGVKGGGILLLPAELAQRAAPAYLLRRPVENDRRVFLLRRRGAVHAVIQRPHCLRSSVQPGAERFPLRCLRFGGGGLLPDAFAAENSPRNRQKQQRSGNGFQQQRHGQSFPGGEHGGQCP